MSDFTTHSTIAWQGQTRLPACLSGAFCPFRLGLRQPRSKGTSLGSIGENMPTQPACVLKSKNHSKTHRRQVRSSFAGAEMCPDKKRPAENTCRIVKGLDAVWAHFCPSKPCLPLSSDGIFPPILVTGQVFDSLRPPVRWTGGLSVGYYILRVSADPCRRGYPRPWVRGTSWR